MSLISAVGSEADSQPSVSPPATLDFSKKKLPDNPLGTAILRCTDQCDLTLAQLSGKLQTVSRRLIAHHADNGLGLYQVIRMPPSTLHSYALPGSTRAIRKYPLEWVLEVLSVIESEDGKDHSRWYSEAEVKAYFSSLQQSREEGGQGMETADIKTATGLSSHMVIRYTRGSYRIRHDKMTDYQSRIHQYLATKKESQER